MTALHEKISFQGRHQKRRFKKIIFSFFSHPAKIIDYLYLRFHGVETGYGDVVLHGFPMIKKCKGSKIILGKGCTLVSTSRHNVAGINHRVILATLTPSAVIKIGRVGVSGSSICAAKGIFIDDDSGLGANSDVYDSDFHPLDPIERLHQTSINDAISKEVKIGKNVWISSNVTILKGITIGDEAIVGAKSVVTSNIPPRTVYAGNPAKKIKDL